MPEYLDVIEANKFWDAPESDIFRLPIVAIALGIGRNKMHLIPVNPIMISRRAYYRKIDILEWALSDQGEVLIKQLRTENSSIGKLAKLHSDFYDYHYSGSLESHYRTPIGRNETKQAKYDRLCKEWGAYEVGYRESIKHRLEICSDDAELERLIAIAWTIREQFVKLRMGLPRGIELRNWWFAKNLTEVKRARIRDSIQWHENELKLLKAGQPNKIFFSYDTFDLAEEIASFEQELVELNAELDEIG